MAKTTKILIATAAIIGGTRDGEKLVTASLAPGEELTAAAMKALGLDQEAVDDLKAKGFVQEVTAQVAEAPAKSAQASGAAA